MDGETEAVGVDVEGIEVDEFYSNEVRIWIDGQDNFCFGEEYGFYGGEISSVGAVDGLGNVKKIPEGGWSKKSAVQPGYGYVVKLKQDKITTTDGELRRDYKKYCRYARIYVVEWDVSTTGGIIGATIRYQDNWKVED